MFQWLLEMSMSPAIGTVASPFSGRWWVSLALLTPINTSVLAHSIAGDHAQNLPFENKNTSQQANTCRFVQPWDLFGASGVHVGSSCARLRLRACPLARLRACVRACACVCVCARVRLRLRARLRARALARWRAFPVQLLFTIPA